MGGALYPFPAHLACQVLVTKEVAEAFGILLNKISATGTSILVEGELSATPEGTKQVGTHAQGHVTLMCLITAWFGSRRDPRWHMNVRRECACICACMLHWPNVIAKHHLSGP